MSWLIVDGVNRKTVISVQHISTLYNDMSNNRYSCLRYIQIYTGAVVQLITKDDND